MDHELKEMLGTILSNQQKMQTDITAMQNSMDTMQNRMDAMQNDIRTMQNDIGTMQNDIRTMQNDIGTMQNDIGTMQSSITDIKLHIENVTDKNIQLIAENYCNLTEKLDKNISVTDKEIAYQIKVNYLVADVEKLKIEVDAIKNKIA